MSDTNTNTFGGFVHIDAIVKQFKILTNNIMRLMESKDVKLIKFLTRNTNTNKYKPLLVVFVNSFVNVELFKFKFLTRNTNTNTSESKPLQLSVDISDVNDVNVELLKFEFLIRKTNTNTNKSKPL